MDANLSPQQQAAFQDACAKIAALTSLTPADVRALAAIDNVDDALAIVRSYQAIGVPVGKSTWDSIVAALTEASQIAGIVIPILGVAGTVRGLLA